MVIMADDLGYGDLSCYDGWIPTPNLDRLAMDGVRMTDFHSSGNVCSPTRAGLLTGRYQQRAGIPGVIYADASKPVHHHGLQPEEITFAEMFQDADYATAIFGKWHLGYSPQYNPIRHGSDQFVGYVSGNVDFFSHVDQAGNFDWWKQDQPFHEDGYTTKLITRHATEFIEANRDRPFCLYVPHETPHYPYQGPNDRAERTVGGTFQNRGHRQDIRTAYREMVIELDHSVGQIRETLRRLNLTKNTLVIFLSDNGATKHGSNGPLRGFKGSNWEGGHRVPCMAAWPSQIPGGQVTDTLSISLDVMPTMLAAAGIEQSDVRPPDGVNLLPVWKDQKTLPARPLVWNGQAIRDAEWKLMVTGNGPDSFSLYNLKNDLGETNDVSAQHPERTRQMRDALVEWKKDVAKNATGQPRLTESP
ncbi:MAG: sulfatase-like hydrolase/transferase [Planctomycetales bacterium]|nr:sulfatase-like hydrolase/transferase [Planctomycetales bacterium]